MHHDLIAIGRLSADELQNTEFHNALEQLCVVFHWIPPFAYYVIPVSYTHLDVYKRQHLYRGGAALGVLGLIRSLQAAGQAGKHLEMDHAAGVLCLAIFLSAEFGFSGVAVFTAVQTPLFVGSSGQLLCAFWNSNPLKEQAPLLSFQIPRGPCVPTG